MLRRAAGVVLGAAVTMMTLSGGLVQAAEGAPSNAAAIVLQDDRGQTVRLSGPPARIVSLLPSLTESVCALGACDRLVGVDDYSNWPPQAAALPRLGGLDTTQIERVVALRPDLVLLSRSSRAAVRLEALGLNVASFEPQSLDDVARVLERTARMLGLPDAPRRAQSLWHTLDAEVTQAATTLKPAQARQRLYVELASGPYAAGPSSFIGGLMERLGARNIVSAELGAYPRLNPETVLQAQPDRIVVGAYGAREMASRPGWSRLRALQQDAVCVFAADEMDVLVRPGPRLGDAARLLADCLAGRMAGLRGERVDARGDAAPDAGRRP